MQKLLANYKILIRHTPFPQKSMAFYGPTNFFANSTMKNKLLAQVPMQVYTCGLHQKFDWLVNTIIFDSSNSLPTNNQ